MIRRPPRSTRTDTLFPYTTLFRSADSFAFIASLSHFIVPIVQMLLASPLRNSGKHQRRHYDPFYISSNLARPRFRWLLSSDRFRSEEHTSELQSLMRISYAVFCLKKQNIFITK